MGDLKYCFYVLVKYLNYSIHLYRILKSNILPLIRGDAFEQREPYLAYDFLYDDRLS